MIIKDIYGDFDIKEPLLLKLIKSKPVERLKGISQYGPPDELFHYKSYSRYEHSVGVMLLLRKLGASLEEQAAGLIHDVSHTAFSHVIDWVVGNIKKENYQDSIHEKFVSESQIPIILREHSLDAKKITNLENYNLLEREAPDLCADRIDYTLREITRSWGVNIQEMISSLKVLDGKIIFNSKVSAKDFATNYLKCQVEHWGAPETMLRYKLLSQALKAALDENIITINDFYFNDAHVLGKIRKSRNDKVLKTINILSGKINFELTDDNPEYRLNKKFRYVDPEYLESSSLKRLSENDSEYKESLDSERIKNEKGISIKIVC